MGIKIINGFDLNSPLPLDSRAVVENTTEMNELITKNFVSIGQTCFNKADNKLYVLKTNNETLEWSEVGGSDLVEYEFEVDPETCLLKIESIDLETLVQQKALISLFYLNEEKKQYLTHFFITYSTIAGYAGGVGVITPGGFTKELKTGEIALIRLESEQEKIKYIVEVFDLKQYETLDIEFDRNGETINLTDEQLKKIEDTTQKIIYVKYKSYSLDNYLDLGIYGYSNYTEDDGQHSTIAILNSTWATATKRHLLSAFIDINKTAKTATYHQSSWGGTDVNSFDSYCSDGIYGITYDNSKRILVSKKISNPTITFED